MELKGRAADVRLRGIERELQNADLRLSWANDRVAGGDPEAIVLAAATFGKMKRLIIQATTLRPTSVGGLAAKARIVGRHHDVPVVGRAIMRSLVENLHDLEHDRRR